MAGFSNFRTRQALLILNKIRNSAAPAVTKETLQPSLRAALMVQTGKVLPENWQTNKMKFLRELQDIHKHSNEANVKRREKLVARDKKQLDRLFKRDKSYQAFLKAQTPPVTTPTS